MLKKEYKEHLIHYGILLGFFIGMFIILITSTLLSRKSWKNCLAREVQTVLDIKNPGVYKISSNIKIKSALSTSASLYEITNNADRSAKKYYAIIVRIPTLLGPEPAVFIYNNLTGTEFAGYAIDAYKAENILKPEITAAIMKYWSAQIPLIISKAVN